MLRILTTGMLGIALAVCIAGCGLAIATDESNQRRVPAFPGAEGYGRFAQGGRGGDVYHVTNLNDSGPGSLRDGIDSAARPRTIVFDLSGTIALKSPLAITKPRITIAGQSAPGDGITIRDQTLEVRHTSDIIIRYIRVRLGDKNKKRGGPDTITVEYSDDLIFDHVSASWGIDANQDERGCKNYTMQWCILSEALNRSLHSKGPHAMCASFRKPLGNMTIHHSLFATSRDRHPTIGGDVAEPQWIIDFRNNVIYNWSGTANVCDNRVNIVNNYFRPGPETNAGTLPIAMKADLPDKARGHMSGNVFERRDDLTANNYAALDFKRWLYPGSHYRYAGTVNDWKVEQRYELGNNTPRTQSAGRAYQLVLGRAGASLRRDAADERVIRDVRRRSGRLIDSQDQVGGWPALKSLPAPKDTDRDGMADNWEIRHRLDPNNPDDRNGDRDGDGYTNLEEYLNGLCPTVY